MDDRRRAYRRALEISELVVAKFGESPTSLSAVIEAQMHLAMVESEKSRELLIAAREGMLVLIERNWIQGFRQRWLETIENCLRDLDDNHGGH